MGEFYICELLSVHTYRSVDKVLISHIIIIIIMIILFYTN